MGYTDWLSSNAGAELETCEWGSVSIIKRTKLDILASNVLQVIIRLPGQYLPVACGRKHHEPFD
jgi:hypothetical protein